MVLCAVGGLGGGAAAASAYMYTAHWSCLAQKKIYIYIANLLAKKEGRKLPFM